MRIAKITAALFVVALLSWPEIARPQDDSTTQTGTSSSAPQTTATGSSQQSGVPQQQPDTHPLSGGFMYTLGSLPEVHSYLQPELSLGEEGFTNPGYVPGAAHGFQSTTVAMGGVKLDLLGERNDFALNYMGGGFIYNSNSSLDSQFHEMSLMDSVRFRRGVLTVADLFSYTPEAGFGLGGVGVLGGFGSGLFSGLGFSTGGGQINPMFGPNQSILTTGYGAYSNTALAEGEYELSPRTSITAMGTFGTLQFGSGTSFLNGNHEDGMFGVNRRLDARNTIGVVYIYSTFHYVGEAVAFHSQAADFTYGRKITGRLSLQAYGGPSFVTYTAAQGNTSTHTYLSGTVDLSYAMGRNTFGMYVGRYSSGGAGVLPGAESTTVSVNWERQVTRTWMLNAYGGYSRNSGYSGSLASQTSTVPTGPRPSFDYWFSDLTLHHPLTRHISLYLGYEFQRSSAPACTIASCKLAPSLTNQVMGIGITYTPRPLQL